MSNRLGLAAAVALAAASAQVARAETVHVEQDCSAAGYTLGTDCFEDMSALSDWLWMGSSPRDPSPAAPVVVNVGEGTFDGWMNCPSYTTSPLVNDSGNPNGWTTFRGLSRKRSRVVSQAGLGLFMQSEDCHGLEFQDLHLESIDDGFFRGIVFFWRGTGGGTFTDVDLVGPYTAWYDYLCGSPSAPVGEHYFYGSNLISGSLGYYAQCGRTWLYGSEVLTRPVSGTFVGGLGVSGIQVSGVGDVRLFGSAVRVDLTGWSGTTLTAYGMKNVASSSQIHMHGGIVNMTSAGDNDLIGVHSSEGMIHTLETAFAMKTGSGGSVVRAAGSGMVQSPLLWQAGDDEPVSGMQSLSGQDLFVETDCDASGCSGSPSDPRPHLMISSEACASSSEGDGTPWFDVVRGACRE